MDHNGVLLGGKLCGLDEAWFDSGGIYNYHIKGASDGLGILALGQEVAPGCKRSALLGVFF